jgi:hypothetical protein
MGKISAKWHEVKSKMHKKAARRGPAKDADHHTKEAVVEKVKEKKERWL